MKQNQSLDFFNRKILMFVKLSLESFIYDFKDTFFRSWKKKENNFMTNT